MSLIAKKIQELLKIKGWNETDLAFKAGISQPTTHRIVTGSSENPRMDNVAAIAKALNVSVAFLAENNDKTDRSLAAKDLIETISTITNNGELTDEKCLLLKDLAEALKKQK